MTSTQYLKSSASFRCRATRAIASVCTTTVTCPANCLAETTVSGSAARIDSTQGWPEASFASGRVLFSSAGAFSTSANQDAFRMTFIRSIFFWSAMIP